MSPRTAKITFASALGVIALAAVPAFTTLAQAAETVRGGETVAEQPAAQPKPAAVEPAAETEPVAETEEAEPVDCLNDPAGTISIPEIEWGATEVYGVTLEGEIADSGPTEFANGTTGLNADGQVTTYTVDEGDTWVAIGARFCIDWNTVSTYNHTLSWALTPGQTLTLRPDPNAAWDPQMDWYWEEDAS